ncbi:MAG: hypothetical protein J6Z31_08805 [Fibrobacter sp.]|nr:hypothetical protein [Fibrobacter sp.]
MEWNFWKKFVCAAPVLYGVAIGVDLCLGDSSEKVLPGSAADTLTLVDKRMAYLVYNLLDSNGMIVGADLQRGEDLFMRNCRPCHGDDGRRMNLSHDMWHPRYIGTTAHDEAPTFWYMMNFGDSARGMLPYIDEIPLSEMIDIAGFAQTLPRHPWSAQEAAEAMREDSILEAKRKKANQQ